MQASTPSFWFGYWTARIGPYGEFWYGLLAPAKTPRTIVARLNREITGILNQPEVRNRWVSLGAEPAPTTPGQFDKLIAEEIATLTKLARASNIRAD